ncbi:MAG: hypothetical protein UH080_01165 [Ruminococcus sp.]|nr:hypothetical protein [Ruminococcus sp.]
MMVNFNGFGENSATFEADSSLTTAGVPVKISGDGKVSACAGGEAFCGICTHLRDGFATVQLAGYVTMPAAEKIATGYTNISAGADGTVSASGSGREYLVLDSTQTTVGFIL